MINRGEVLAKIEKEYMTKDENFKVGNTVKVYVKIIEGKKERIQVFEGIVIDIHGSGLNRMFKVRKMVGQIGVERTFPLHSPSIQKIEVVKTGTVRRAKLFYLRGRIGKASQLKNVLESQN
ncbi:MAG TPA: 50S ribosomal protein L19 [Spirochaetota bacterium]|nr:50S ribosomal protein L19 [Spirochaetota bacterium]